MNIKTIYEFNIMVDKEVEKTETKNENGVETITKTKVLEKAPIYFAFKKASRTDREICEETRAAAWSKAVEAGIQPEAILIKSKYGESFMNDTRKNYIDTLAALDIKRKELDKENADKDSINNDIRLLNDNIVQIQRDQMSFFENTAEVKARVKAIEWLTLNMSYFREDKNKDWQPFFKGDTLKEKYDSADKMDDENNDLYNKSRDKLSLAAAAFLTVGNGVTADMIDEMMK